MYDDGNVLAATGPILVIGTVFGFAVTTVHLVVLFLGLGIGLVALARLLAKRELNQQ